MTVHLFRPRQRGQNYRIDKGKVILGNSGPVHELRMSSCYNFLAYLDHLASFDGVFHIERHGATAGIATKDSNDPFHILQIISKLSFLIIIIFDFLETYAVIQKS